MNFDFSGGVGFPLFSKLFTVKIQPTDYESMQIAKNTSRAHETTDFMFVPSHRVSLYSPYQII